MKTGKRDIGLSAKIFLYNFNKNIYIYLRILLIIRDMHAVRVSNKEVTNFALKFRNSKEFLNIYQTYLHLYITTYIYIFIVYRIY